MKNSAITTEAKVLKEGSSLSYTLYASEVTNRILTTEEVTIFQSAFKKHATDRASGLVPQRLDCEGVLADHFSHATINQTFLNQHAYIDPTQYCEFSDEEAVAIATSSRQKAKSSLENLRSETLKDLTKFYWYYLNNIDKQLLKQQQSPLQDFIPR